MSIAVSVIITTYDRRPILGQALAALEAQSYSDFRTIVVDDASTDDSWQWLQTQSSRPGSRLDIVRQETNSGQGRARNRGLELVDDGLVIFLGDDIIASPSLVAEHLAARATSSTSKPHVVVGFTDWHREHMKVSPLLEMINLEGHQFGYGHMQPGEAVPFTCFYTSNLSVEREVLGARPFDPSFVGYGWEDIELGYRLSQRGIDIVYHPAATAAHLHPMSLASVFARQRTVGRGLERMLELHPELTDSPLLTPTRTPMWFELGKHIVPPLVPLLDWIDRIRIPLPVAVLHRVLLCAFYLGHEESIVRADMQRAE